MPKTKNPEEKLQEEEKPVENMRDVIPTEVKEEMPEVEPVKEPETKIETINTTAEISDEEEPESNKKPILITIIVALTAFVLGAVLGSLIIYRQYVAKLNDQTKTAETVSLDQADSTPSAVPAELPVDLTKFEIEVLNGSDTKGVAGALEEELTGAGFNVSTVGNATSSAFIKTVLSTKKDLDKDYLTKLQELLQKSHALSVDQDLKDDAKTDVLIIIGAE